VPPGGRRGTHNFGLGGAALNVASAASKRFYLLLLDHALRFLVLTVCLAFAGLPAWSQVTSTEAASQKGASIERIEFQGNRRIRSETLQARIFSRPGDPYSDAALQRDFRALWNTQYFSDIRLEVQDSPDKPNGKIVIFHVVERPIIRRIEYHGIKSITQSDILDQYKNHKVDLSVEDPFDPTEIMRAEVVIKELLAQHGRQFAAVKATYQDIPTTGAVLLTFNVDEGPKVKVGQISFVGNHAFSDRKLIRAMRNSRPYAVPMWLFDLPVLSKTYDRSKLDEDLEIGVRGLYQDNGYFKVLVKDPILKTVNVNRAGLPVPLPVIGRERGKATNITIPIEEGEQYRMGRLVIRSADPDKGLSIKRQFLEEEFPLKKGDIFDVEKIRKAIQNYTKLYGVYGYIDFTATPETDVHDDTKTVDLTFDFDEEKQYFVRRIDFSGNLTTRDKVIRRELLINEGDIFNNHYWELSLLRLNQLNYFEKIKPEDAQIKRNTKQSTVDILLKVKEKGKQSISLTGGVSGLAGSFIGLSYQTNNFLGLGETLTFSTQFGNLERSFMFGFTEPYLFDRPISTGFTVFSSRYTFNQSQQTSLLLGQKVQIDPNIEQDYNQNSTGGTIFVSYPLRRFSFTRLGVTYGYSDTNIQAFSNASTLLFEALRFQSLAGASALSGIRSSRLSPTLTYNTVDNPVNPTHGKSLYYSFSLEGGPLGGNVNAMTQVFEAKYFRPINRKRNVLAFHLVGSFATGYGGRVLPPYERLFLGGETDLRGFDTRTVTPIAFIPLATTTTISFLNPRQLDIAGNPQLVSLSVPTLAYQITFPGGDTSGVFNGEYRIPLIGPVSMSLFTDVGTVGALKPNQLQLASEGFSNLGTEFPGVSVSDRLQIQSGTNFKLRASSGVEFVVQLPIVNAPFRLYWAYNFDRLSEQIVAPPSHFNTDAILGQVPPDIFNSVILPQLASIEANPQRINFFEPKSTFRFTVSRTF
jgi:outer membrane protein insertion porin family